MDPIRLLIIVLVAMLVLGVLPVWPYATAWGWGPSGVGLVVFVVILFVLVRGDL